MGTLVQALEYKKNPASFIVTHIDHHGLRLPVGPTGVSDTKYLFNVAHRPTHHEQAYRKYEQSPKPQRHERQAMINRYNESLANNNNQFQTYISKHRQRRVESGQRVIKGGIEYMRHYSAKHASFKTLFPYFTPIMLALT